jgi:arylsulfatase A-like enzyme
MDALPPESASRRSASRNPLSPMAAILMAISFGLCGGYLDLVLMLIQSLWWTDDVPKRIGRDFPWTVPVGLALLLLVPAVMVAAVNRLRPGLVSLRTGSWLFATLAIWAALLRMPLYGACTLLLAIGVSRPISAVIANRSQPSRLMRSALVGSLGVLAVLAALSSGRQAIRERLAMTALPPPPPGARNVILIVWDTVRAYNLSLYGYPRKTTPNLTRWAREGVRFRSALAPAPWTYPSHSSFFTGQWPFQLNSQWQFTLDAPGPTLAEYLASRGYQTAGFAANTTCCNYESGLARGFAHFEDYPLTLRSLLGRTAPGNWILRNFLYRFNYYQMKWIYQQSRGARGTDEAFLAWLRGRRPDRPFYAFLNYFDAHEPYIPPPGHEGRFGIRPRAPGGYYFLIDYMQMDKKRLMKRDVEMARDCYDDCISFLDEQLDRLLNVLRAQGLLDNTLVIITSDHGEAFGDHGFFGHSHSVFLDEIGVPLVVLSPGAPAGRVVDNPVSLRNLPATVVDLLGFSAGAPFPGRSLAAHFGTTREQTPPGIATPALSEQANAAAFQPQLRASAEHGGFQMSLVAKGHHYVRDGLGAEMLFNLAKDPFERVNLMGSSDGGQVVRDLRRSLLEALNEKSGSTEVEAAYLLSYRRGLEALIEEKSPTRGAISP